jgi:transcriptional regulator GlxA family with amidase domain
VAETVAIGVWDGVEELDFAGPYEVLAAWARFSDRDVDVVIVADGADPVTCAHGLRVVPDRTWDELDEAAVVVMPGGGVNDQLVGGPLVGHLQRLAADGTLMTSVCTGAFLYAAAGFLDGKPATTHWGSVERLAEQFDAIEVRPDARFVDAGDVVTAAGVSAGIDMALHLVERLDSTEMARRVRRYIQYDPEPPV